MQIRPSSPWSATAMVQTGKHRARLIRPVRRHRGARWRHLLPLLLLLFLLGALAVKDALTDAPRRQEVAVRDEPPEDRQGRTAAPVALRVDIQDEPEERAPDAVLPVKVVVKDEPEEGGHPPDPGPAG